MPRHRVLDCDGDSEPPPLPDQDLAGFVADRLPGLSGLDSWGPPEDRTAFLDAVFAGLRRRGPETVTTGGIDRGA